MGLLDNLGGAAKSMANDLIGNNRHAVIMVWDYRQKMAETNKAVNIGDSLKATTKVALKDKDWLATRPNDVAGTMKTFSVQFNPSKLHISAHNDPSVHGDVTGKKAGSTTKASLPPTLELRVELIFDRVNIGDAFIGDKFSSFASAQAISNLATAITKATGTQLWTVKPEVEAFIAALRNPATRNISFVWKNFEFNGVLKNLNVEYTMFSPAGRPIRAKMGLRIRQELVQANQTFWEKCFDEAFESGGGTLSLTKLF